VRICSQLVAGKKPDEPHNKPGLIPPRDQQESLSRERHSVRTLARGQQIDPHRPDEDVARVKG